MTKLSEKIGYGFGDLASSMFWKIFSYFIPFFYADIFGLKPAHAGFLILITKIYDAISDPVMGMIADRTQTKWGKYRPYLLWVAIPFAVVGVLTFYTPQGTYAFKHVYAYVTYLLLMTCYTAVNVPYGAMLGVVSDDAHEKSVFSSFRMFFAYVGSFISMGIFSIFEQRLLGTQRIVDGAPLFDASGNAVLVTSIKEAQPMQFTGVVAIVAVLTAIFFILSFLLTREHVSVPRKESGAASVRKDLAALLRNKPWWMLTLASIFLLICGAMRGGATVYYFSNILGTSALFGSVIFLTIGEVAQMLGVPLAVPLSEKLGRKGTGILALMFIAVASALIYFVPATGTGFWILLALQILVCVGIGVISPLLWAMFSDVADYTELRDGSASTGLVFSSSSMAQKFGSAFGSAIVAWVLAFSGYEKGVMEAGGAVDGAIRGLMSYLPAAAALVGVGFLVLYPLTTGRMRSIRAELKARRG